MEFPFVSIPATDPTASPRFPVSSESGYESGSSQVSRDVVQVVEFKLADNELEDEFTFAIRELPDAVVSAVMDRFPGARLLAGELDNDDGERHFDVSAELGGTEFSITLAPDGEILEVDQSLRTADLPQPVRDWIERNYPGASIRDAELSAIGNAVSYEVSFDTSTQQAFEATLQFAAGQSTGPVADTIDQGIPVISMPLNFNPQQLGDITTSGHSSQAGPDSPVPIDTKSPIGITDPASVPTASSSVLQQAQSATRIAESTTNPAAAGELASTDDLANLNSVEATKAIPDTNTTDQIPIGLAMLPPAVSFLARATPAVWIPQFAAALENVFALDIDAIELSLQEFLSEIDSFAEQVVLDSVSSRLTPGILFTALVVTGAERLLSEIKKRKMDPVLAKPEGKSTWTWVMGLSTVTPTQDR